MTYDSITVNLYMIKLVMYSIEFKCVLCGYKYALCAFGKELLTRKPNVLEHTEQQNESICICRRKTKNKQWNSNDFM